MAVLELNQEQFDRLIGEGKPLLVDFWAPWCGYCRRIGPAYDKIAAKYGDRLMVAKLNIDEAPAVAHRENIEVIPTLVLYRDGKDIASVTAPESFRAIEQFIQENI